ncbi:type 1 glutamine amidotransferase domain-containing protein [Paenibacillus aurantius]|uniref:Type 1 glutamine amidotransferase domain-containing protein n=1 Tax=Paenibacillus aurantius TaxID=2918900 RepID=A0AA96LIH5_9BACL|nr:type 1 glutamine amidotransferase domain-containing protein [Paenibacillus aurantius]WNQ13860.1 type 1 glutamine amidotransferase domain-containing protein [Paenibacillus aurantius]
MKKIAFLLANGFEDSEMQKPYEELGKAGYETVIVGQKQGEELQGKNKSVTYTSDKSIDEVNASDYDAVVIPGGSSPENLRLNSKITDFVKQMNSNGKPIAAICHGPQILASANLLKGRTITCYQPLQDDMRNAGAEFVDKEVVVDGNFITSRQPKDEPAFIREIKNKLGE